MSEIPSSPLGKIILLNGASSSGKSSIASAVQAKINEPFWHISIDHLRDAGVLPLDRIRQGEFRWADMRGAFFDGFERSLLAYVQSGNNLIVEYIIETPEWMDRLNRLLKGCDVFFVGVRCGLEELERRELARRDRRIGGARHDFDSVHGHCLYDAELDGMQPPDANAERLISLWETRTHPLSFEKMLVR